MDPASIRSTGSRDAAAASTQPSGAEVEAQLGRILASVVFRGSARLQRFLQVAVERTLAGEGDRLKEYAVGRDVFDRGADYDPRVDSIVRVEAQRLRRKLREYYQDDGRMDPVVISLPPGGYAPAFARPAQPGPVLARTEGARAEGERFAASAPPDSNTVAVLPFSNLSQEPEQQYFCDGITEDIINALTSIPELQVIGRTSMFALRRTAPDPREIGARLGAGTIIEGTVRKAGDVLRVSAKIIDAETRQARWSQVFDRKTTEVFRIEDEIARSIANTLRVTVGSGQPADTRHQAPAAEAHTLYLRGRQAWNQLTRDGFLSAIELFSRAIALYPDYAPPYAGLADAYVWLSIWGMIRPKEALPKSQRLAQDAIRLNPELASASVSLGATACFLDREWDQGLALFRKALSLQPSYSVGLQLHGICLMELRRFEEAMTYLERAVVLDPLSVRANRSLGALHYVQGRDQEARHWFESAAALHPEAPESHYLLARMHLQQRRYKEALEAARKCDTTPPSAFPLSVLGVSLARNGDHAGAERILRRLAEMSLSAYVDPLPSAFVQVALGNREAALDEFEKSIDEHSPFAALANVDPLLDELRSEARFRDLIGLLKFPQP